MTVFADHLQEAAAILLGKGPAKGRAADLLLDLDYIDGATELAPHRAALLRAAGKFRRIFRLPAMDAPALVVLGAEVDPPVVGFENAPPTGVSGAGLTFRQAFETCIGEGVEHLSQYATMQDPIERRRPEEVLPDGAEALVALWQGLVPRRRNPAAELADWSVAADLADGSPVFLPTDLCLRRPEPVRDIDVPWPLGTGCAAGQDHFSATLHGLFELIERDAVALWWRGGAPPRLVLGEAGAGPLARLRDGTTSRRSWFLDITSDTGVPTVVAAACDDRGFGFCCGSAARPTLAMAADAAARELAQIELAYRLSAAKRDTQGAQSLNAVDIRHIRRFSEVEVARTPVLHPRAPPRAPNDLPAGNRPALLAALRHCLARVGLTPCALDLTRDSFNIPVVRTVCPGLEPGFDAPPGPRLRAMAALHDVDLTAEVLL